MLTKITIRNFKLFKDVEIPLGNGFVFIGPNNGGKTSALQALTLWHAGLQQWAHRHAQRAENEIPKIAPELPVAEMDLIWLNRKVKKGVPGARRGTTENIRIDLIVEGIHEGTAWKCGLEFDYSNQDSIFCRPLRIGNGEKPDRMKVPKEALNLNITFLPPMSGLSTEEALVQEGRINVLTGQGQTAEVLRNLCYRVYSKDDKQDWESLVDNIKNLFGITLKAPFYLSSRGSITMSYIDQSGGVTLDLPSSGRGMQQVLLLLAHLYDNTSNTVFLLDEPDAHLEILRQRQIYNLITEVADQKKSQIISASHSEVLLGEAAQRESAVAFVGKPHTLGANKKSYVLAALKEVGFEYYYGAERKGWILYLEDASDLMVLRAFANHLNHRAKEFLQDPLVKYLETNLPEEARKHFRGLREAKTDLVGILLMDRIDKKLQNEMGLSEIMWKQREIENYLCNRKALMDYASSDLSDDLFGFSERNIRREKMEEAIVKIEEAARTLNKSMPFSVDIKASDDFLSPLFKNFASSIARDPSLERYLCSAKERFPQAGAAYSAGRSRRRCYQKIECHSRNG